MTTAPTLAVVDIEGGKKVTATNNQTGATLRYTTDGNDPTTSSTAYTSAGISLTTSGTHVVKVGAFKNGMATGISSVTVTIE